MSADAPAKLPRYTIAATGKAFVVVDLNIDVPAADPRVIAEGIAERETAVRIARLLNEEEGRPGRSR